MARFQLKPKATLRQLGEKVQQLATMSNTAFDTAAADPKAFFSSVLDLPKGMKVVLVKDGPNLRHVIVPHYKKPPKPEGAESVGIGVFCGCGD
jgi:hypothetical protein